MGSGTPVGVALGEFNHSDTERWKKDRLTCRFRRASFDVLVRGRDFPGWVFARPRQIDRLAPRLRTQMKKKEDTMKFLSIYKSIERNAPPSQEEMAKMGKLVEEGFKAGWLLATEGCLPTALGARVRNSSGKLTVTDGPFTEAKEVVGGFAILRANSKQEAIQLARDFLQVVGEGECELRQIFEADTCVQKAATS
jgi:hypothetical protein